MEKRLEKLFEPVSIGSMVVKNRIVMAPMGTTFGDSDGKPTPRELDYYEARAAGGAGMVIVEATLVDPSGQIISSQLRIHDDHYIPGLRDLAGVIKKHGARAVVQLHHAGREARSKLTGLQPIAPSPIPGRSGEVPRQLTVAEIEALVGRFADAAERAREAGFDGVEIHGAHAYLFVQFLTPAFNSRRDEYGGSLENRARFLLSVVAAIRRRVGRGYPLWARVNARHYGVEGGITLEETKQVARWLEMEGVDAVNVSCYGAGIYNFVNCPEIPGALVPLAEAIKGEVSVPVIAVGYMDPETGEAVLCRGQADLIAVARGFLADPEFPNKAASGRIEDICPCIACFRCLRDMLLKGMDLHCAVNPMLGHEREYALRPADKAKKVVVVGGGPAGMEAALVAAQRGHNVTLYERGPQLGGQLLLAAKPPMKEPLGRLTAYLETQVRKSGVRVELGTEATPALVQRLAPDVVVLATGVVPLLPDIPGLDGVHVVMAQDVLADKATTGRRVVVIGGELVGCETADFLADRGCEVTIVRRGQAMLTNKMPFLREAFLEKLASEGVRMLTGVRYEQATEEGLVVFTAEGERKLLGADTIVVAAGARANRSLHDALEGKVLELHMVGDCVEPRQILEAIHDGFQVGRTL